jgi:DEAD/DEAH box helicase domain-containing protein
MGGISFVEHPGIKGSAVFFYDGYPGGVGLASRIFEVFPELLKRTYDLIRDCKCSDGCPSCIHSPRCGSGNHPLDKKAVRELLQRFEGEGDFKVKEEKAPLEQVISKPSLIVRPRPRPDFTGTLVFDLETKLSPDEVGGWKNIPDMLMAVGVVMEVHSRKYRIFYEEEAERLISVLKKAELVVGFNLNRFDYKVLSHYGLKSPAEIRTLDLLDEVVNALGFRLKLDNLCQATLNTPKSASGEKSLEWVKAGKLDLVTEYCQMDVKLTRDLYLFGKENGYVFYQDKQAGKKKLQVNW